MEATAIVPAKMKVAWSGLVGGGYGGGERENLTPNVFRKKNVQIHIWDAGR